MPTLNDAPRPHHTPLSEAPVLFRVRSEGATSVKAGSIAGTTLDLPPAKRWRRSVGLLLLSFVVFLWTASNFLASHLLADGTYSKPFMVTYLNTSAFIVPLVPIIIHKAITNPKELKDWRWHWRSRMFRRPGARAVTPSVEGVPHSHTGSTMHTQSALLPESERLLPGGILYDGRADHLSASTLPHHSMHSPATRHERLNLAGTARVSFEFCLIWFAANYFVTACLEYTTVASSTILTSTSSIFTLAVGSRLGVERFTLRKALGVLASFAGVALIASTDALGQNTDADHRGDFPAKSRGEVLLGDSIALASAAMYGIYSVLMKKRLGDEGRVNMPLFFGLVGLFNVLIAWPGFIVLHMTGVEPFELPPTRRVTFVLALNSLASLLSDLAWAWAVLLTSPIVVSVGLALTIPLSLVGQLLINRQTSGGVYWLGAAVVVCSFLVINNEEKKDEVVAVWESRYTRVPDHDTTRGGEGDFTEDRLL